MNPRKKKAAKPTKDPASKTGFMLRVVTPLQTPEEFIRGTPAKPETKYLPDEEKILSGEEGGEQGFAAEKKKRTGGSSL